MHLKEVIAKYRQLSGGFGKAVPLAAFGLSREETERLFSVFDEDYHISRFFHFSDQPEGDATSYQINGFPHTHVTLAREIEEIL